MGPFRPRRMVRRIVIALTGFVVSTALTHSLAHLPPPRVTDPAPALPVPAAVRPGG